MIIREFYNSYLKYPKVGDDELCFTVWDDEELVGEFTIKTVRIGNESALRLEAFNDGWAALWQCRDLLSLLASDEDADIESLTKQLEIIGYANKTVDQTVECYRLPTESEIQTIEKLAAEWTNPANMFTDCGSCSKSAVREFLANQKGLTLFKSAAGKPILR